MKPSEALTAHRVELRQIVSRYGLLRPRIFGSVLTGSDTDDSDLDLLVDATATTTLFTLAGVETLAFHFRLNQHTCPFLIHRSWSIFT